VLQNAIIRELEVLGESADKPVIPVAAIRLGEPQGVRYFAIQRTLLSVPAT
jgi:hypothetical protein